MVSQHHGQRPRHHSLTSGAPFHHTNREKTLERLEGWQRLFCSSGIRLVHQQRLEVMFSEDYNDRLLSTRTCKLISSTRDPSGNGSAVFVAGWSNFILQLFSILLCSTFLFFLIKYNQKKALNSSICRGFIRALSYLTRYQRSRSLACHNTLNHVLRCWLWEDSWARVDIHYVKHALLPSCYSLYKTIRDGALLTKAPRCV